MSDHVTHLLTAYSEGLLAEPDAERVRQHVARCTHCRAALEQHEQLIADLRLTLAASSVPTRHQVDTWWETIRTRPVRPRVHIPRRSYIPLTIALALLFLPAMVGFGRAAVAMDAQETAMAVTVEENPAPDLIVTPIIERPPAVATPAHQVEPVPQAPTTAP